MSCDFLLLQAYDNIVLAKVEKERLLDLTAIASLAEALIKELDRHAKVSMVLDLSAVAAMSSAMLGKLVALHKAVKAQKGRLALAGLQPGLVPLFTITKLDKVFEIFGEAEQALLHYRKNRL